MVTGNLKTERIRRGGKGSGDQERAVKGRRGECQEVSLEESGGDMET